MKINSPSGWDFFCRFFFIKHQMYIAHDFLMRVLFDSAQFCYQHETLKML